MALPYNVSTVDVSLLKNSKIVDYLVRQKPGVTVYFPEVAEIVAKQMSEIAAKHVVNPSYFLARPAVKALRQRHTLKKIFAVPGWDGADCASIEEVRACIELGIDPAKIGFSNLWAGKSELRKAVKLGVIDFVADREFQVDCLAAAAKSQGARIQITLRVQLHSMSQSTKFGILPEYLEDMVQYTRKRGVDVQGLAFHSGWANTLSSGGRFEDSVLPILEIAPLRNKLYKEGWIKRRVNTEGGYSPAYTEAEFDWRSIMDFQGETLAKVFDDFEWQIEPGRPFGRCACTLVAVSSIKDGKRSGLDYPLIGLRDSLYTGAHDARWTQYACMKLSDVKNGNLYTYVSHPEQFDQAYVVGDTCAHSDWYFQEKPVWMPRSINPGDTLLFLGTGCYNASSLGPEGFKKTMRKKKPYEGFNSKPWTRIDVYPHSIHE